MGRKLIYFPGEEESGEGVEEEDLLRAFGNGRKKDLDKLYLGHAEFKKAWLKVANLKEEFQKRGLKYDPSPLAQSRARERLNRIITDQEDAYLENLKKINDIVENVKKDRRQKKDDKKRDKMRHILRNLRVVILDEFR